MTFSYLSNCQHGFPGIEDEDEGHSHCSLSWAKNSYRTMNCSRGKTSIKRTRKTFALVF